MRGPIAAVRRFCTPSCRSVSLLNMGIAGCCCESQLSSVGATAADRPPYEICVYLDMFCLPPWLTGRSTKCVCIWVQFSCFSDTTPPKKRGRLRRADCLRSQLTSRSTYAYTIACSCSAPLRVRIHKAGTDQACYRCLPGQSAICRPVALRNMCIPECSCDAFIRLRAHLAGSGAGFRCPLGEICRTTCPTSRPTEAVYTWVQLECSFEVSPSYGGDRGFLYCPPGEFCILGDVIMRLRPPKARAAVC